MSDVKLKARETVKRTLSLATEETHRITLTLPKAHVLDAEDHHFNSDRSVLLPDLAGTKGKSTPLSPRRVTGLGVVFAALVHARKNPAQRLFITGHVDDAEVSSHQSLSESRAENVSLLLRGQRGEWARRSAKDNSLDDIQTVLAWLHQRTGWDCAPGPINNKANKATVRALRAFQEAFNREVERTQAAGTDSPFKKKIAVDGKVGGETWEAVYDTYMVELMDFLELETYAELQQLQGQLQTPPGMPNFVGCGEHISFKADRRKATSKEGDARAARPAKQPGNRRVEILFLDPGEEVDLVCHPQPGQCKPTNCPVYFKIPHQQTPIEIPVGLGLAEVNLRLTFVDPEGNVRPFPAGLPVQAKFGEPPPRPVPPRSTKTANNAPIIDDRDSDEDADSHEQAATSKSSTATQPSQDQDEGALEVQQEPTASVGENGLLQLAIPRRASTLHLELLAGERRAISADAKSLDDQSLLTVEEASAEVAKGRLFFCVPPALNTREGYFELQGNAPGATFKDGVFVDVDNKKTPLGSREKPLELRLAIKWQHLKIGYFDRWTSSFSTVGQSEWNEDTQSAAPPIVLRGDPRLLEASDEPLADGVASAWTLARDKETIHCLGWVGRRIIAGQDARLLPDDGCTTYFAAADLFVRTDGDGASEDAPRRLVKLAANDKAIITPGAERLRYYDLPPVWRSRSYPARLGSDPADRVRPFEEVVTTPSTLDQPYVVSLDVLVLDPVAGAVAWDDKDVAKRFTIFDNKLEIHKADPPTAGEPYFTDLAQLTPRPRGPVLCDLPGFTRLVTRGKNVYDVFDRRTEPSSRFRELPVGARLAVSLPPDRPLPMTMSELPFRGPRPDATRDNDHGLGNAVLLVLRCCGRDGNTEVFHVLQYASLTFNFAFKATPEDLEISSLLKRVVVLAESPSNAIAISRKCILEIADRWNGEDLENPHRTSFDVVDDPPARGRYKAFLSRGGLAPSATAGPGEMRINLFQSGRSFVSGSEGYWSLQEISTDPRTRGHMPAHEAGHIFGLPDEYLNTDDLPAYDQPHISEAFRSPGTPYGLDTTAMMTSNREIRARYFWNLVLSAREKRHFSKASRIAVNRGSHSFSTDFTTPDSNQVRFPTVQRTDLVIPPLGLCDLFVYVTGADEFTGGQLAGSSSGNPFDGFVVVRVKMEWKFPHCHKYDDISLLMRTVHRTIHARFNEANRIALRCSLDGKPLRLRLLFAPRFVCPTFPSDSEAARYLAALALPTPPNQQQYEHFAEETKKTHGVHASIEVTGGIPGISLTDVPRRGLVRQDNVFLRLFTDARFRDDVTDVFGQLVGGGPKHTGTLADYLSLIASLPQELGHVIPEPVA